ncbi:hypothetical protein [Streptomyces nanshensis]|uniref:Uncharacterized protein n=1 Tax=Streptomyces nanshensis TaxID=518642 RepID=A0A1E7KZ26_9ACTN|nr:hypothetical protein [Streptomyces nanshensis]OEV09208.1 hypothetical protein AN218_22285 [Streptomyces nanshensis]
MVARARRFHDRESYYRAFPWVEDGDADDAPAGSDYTSGDGTCFPDIHGNQWLLTFSRDREFANCAPHGLGRGNLLACRYGSTDILLLAEDIPMHLADDVVHRRLLRPGRVTTLEDVISALRGVTASF